MATKKMLTESLAEILYSKIVIIGPEDEWPTGLPDGTLVIRTEPVVE